MDIILERDCHSGILNNTKQRLQDVEGELCKDKVEKKALNEKSRSKGLM